MGKWNLITTILLLLSLTFIPAQPVWAQDKDDSEQKKKEKQEELEDVTVTATGVKSKLKDFEGTANVISKDDIDKWKPASSLDLLKRIPGVVALEEDSAGFKPNIGIRGLDPTRSRGGVVLLIDGIPFNPGPFADPGAYYNVPIQRIERIEVIKGGSSILYGPNAVGGVVNYITKGAPKETQFWFRETAGDDGYWVNELSYGGAWDDIAGYVNVSSRQGDGFRENSEFSTEDISTKWFLKTGKTRLSFHFDYYNEDQETPRGLSPVSFEDSVRNSDKQNDFFEGQRFSFDLVTNTELSPKSSLRTLLYFNAFERDWHIEGASKFYGTNTLSSVNRRFEVLGFEPQYTARHEVFGFSSDFIAGLRVSGEREHENLTESADLSDKNGQTFSTSIIEALGTAFYLQNAFHVTGSLTVTPGARMEWVNSSRNNDLANSNLDDLKTNGPKGGTQGDDQFFYILPGIGATYDLDQSSQLHGGLWRSASVPQFGSGAEAIDKVTGQTRGLDPEIGLTYEFGVRSEPVDWLSIDATLFLLTYKDQIGKFAGVTSNLNDTRHQGLELSLTAEPFTGFLPFINATLLDSEFTGGPFDGNDTPNAPDTTINAGFDYRFDIDDTQFISSGLSYLYVGERFSDADNTELEDASGKKGELNSYNVWDARVSYHKKNWPLEVFVGARNLFDKKYRLWRFGGGIIPGQDRFVYIGASLTF